MEFEALGLHELVRLIKRTMSLARGDTQRRIETHRRRAFTTCRIISKRYTQFIENVSLTLRPSRRRKMPHGRLN